MDAVAIREKFLERLAKEPHNANQIGGLFMSALFHKDVEWAPDLSIPERGMLAAMMVKEFIIRARMLTGLPIEIEQPQEPTDEV